MDSGSSGSAMASSTADTDTAGTATIRLTAAFAPSTVLAGTGAVSMSQRADPSSDIDAAVVDEMAQKNASAQGSSVPMKGLNSGGSASSDTRPVMVPTEAAKAATSTNTNPMQEFMI